jgi:hypothetical protein
VSGGGGGGGDGDGDDVAPSAAATLGAGAFLDELPRASIAEINGVKIGLLGVCTTSTPLSSAKKPVGVVFADAIPMARHHARELLPRVDAIVALTHQARSPRAFFISLTPTPRVGSTRRFDRVPFRLTDG